MEAYETSTTKKCIRELVELLNQHQLEYFPIVGIVWDNPEITLHDQCRYDIGVQVEAEDQIPAALNVQEIPGGVCAVYRVEISDNDLEQPWDDFVAWLLSNGYHPSLEPGYEIFHKFDLENLKSNWVMELCIPVTPL